MNEQSCDVVYRNKTSCLHGFTLCCLVVLFLLSKYTNDDVVNGCCCNCACCLDSRQSSSSDVKESIVSQKKGGKIKRNFIPNLNFFCGRRLDVAHYWDFAATVFSSKKRRKEGNGHFVKQKNNNTFALFFSSFANDRLFTFPKG